MVGGLQSLINISASFLVKVQACASGCTALSNPEAIQAETLGAVHYSTVMIQRIVRG